MRLQWTIICFFGIGLICLHDPVIVWVFFLNIIVDFLPGSVHGIVVLWLPHFINPHFGKLGCWNVSDISLPQLCLSYNLGTCNGNANFIHWLRTTSCNQNLRGGRIFFTELNEEEKTQFFAHCLTLKINNTNCTHCQSH